MALCVGQQDNQSGSLLCDGAIQGECLPPESYPGPDPAWNFNFAECINSDTLEYTYSFDIVEYINIIMYEYSRK
jgi:hypothetical protein